MTAYTLGMRHAFDARPQPAIDNTTRKLMADGQRPMSVGVWFSLGHSSVVFAMVTLLALVVRALAGALGDEHSTLQTVSGVWGTAVSGFFLVLIGGVNLGALVGILKVSRRMRTGAYDEAELERQLDSRGFLNRVLGPVTRAVRQPWHMYPVGFLFGLSVAVALGIGVVELGSILIDNLGFATGPLAWIGSIELGDVGFWIVALFVGAWLAAIAIWRLGRIEERWSRGLAD